MCSVGYLLPVSMPWVESTKQLPPDHSGFLYSVQLSSTEICSTSLGNSGCAPRLTAAGSILAPAPPKPPPPPPPPPAAGQSCVTRLPMPDAAYYSSQKAPLSSSSVRNTDRNTSDKIPSRPELFGLFGYQYQYSRYLEVLLGTVGGISRYFGGTSRYFANTFKYLGITIGTLRYFFSS